MYYLIAIWIEIMMVEGMLIPLELTTANTAVLWMEDLCGEGVKLLLDTGSQQLCLNDHACWSCGQSGSFCPQVKSSQKSVHYVQGSIEGSESFLRFCGVRVKFFCVRGMNNMESIPGHGIWGLGGTSTGTHFLFRLLQLHHIPTKLITFYYGRSEAFMVLGDPHPYFQAQPVAQLPITNKWEVEGESLHMCGRVIIGERMKYTVDTGSSTIVLPTKYMKEVLHTLFHLYGMECVHTMQGIACPRLPYQLDFTIMLPTPLVVSTVYLLDPLRNVIKIVGGAEDNSVILGYPLLKSYIVSADMDAGRLSLFTYDHATFQSEVWNTHILFVMYLCVMVSFLYLLVSMMRWVGQKREKTLII